MSFQLSVIHGNVTHVKHNKFNLSVETILQVRAMSKTKMASREHMIK